MYASNYPSAHFDPSTRLHFTDLEDWEKRTNDVRCRATYHRGHLSVQGTESNMEHQDPPPAYTAAIDVSSE